MHRREQALVTPTMLLWITTTPKQRCLCAALKLAKAANDKMMVKLQFGHVIDCNVIILAQLI